MQSVIVEWGYNMLEGLRRYSDDPEVEFFKQLLDGEVSEAVLLDMNAVALAVFDQLKALQDKESRRAPATGASQEAQAAATTVTGYRATLEKAFVAKGAKRLEALVQSARAPHPVYRKKTMEVAWKEGGGTVQYDLLFSEDESFEAGPFLAMLRTQYLQEHRYTCMNTCACIYIYIYMLYDPYACMHSIHTYIHTYIHRNMHCVYTHANT